MEFDIQPIVTAIGFVFALLTVYVPQVGFVTALTAFIKTTFNLAGRIIPFVSFVLGAGLGGLIVWAALFYNPDFPLPIKVLMVVLFVLSSGLVASGFYDYRNPTPKV